VRGERAPLATFEASFRPSDYDEDVEAAEQRQPGAQATPEYADGDSVHVEEEVVQGFRIQIFASSRIDDANLAKQTALQLITTDSLYIVYDPPVYKVRVGDYLTRLEANRALSSIVQRGYPDAWIVTDRIIQRKFMRVPRTQE
jgi:septal ring-binding cell division protein DamX